MTPELTPETEGKAMRQKGRREPEYHLGELNKTIAVNVINLAKEAPRHMSDLVEKTEEAALALNEAVQGCAHHLETFKPLKKDITNELRGLRSVAVTETAALLGPLKDLRKFFIGNEHEEEIKRLKEFVDLCERLQAIQKSGFLDTIADAMLKLDTPSKS